MIENWRGRWDAETEQYSGVSFCGEGGCPTARTCAWLRTSRLRFLSPPLQLQLPCSSPLLLLILTHRRTTKGGGGQMGERVMWFPEAFTFPLFPGVPQRDGFI